jgi:hypothetical protein
VAKDASSAANLAMLANHCASCNAYAGRYRTALTDSHVVGDLDLIIELAPGTNDRVINRSAVNRGVGTNFAVIANPNRPRLGDFDPFVAISGKPESIGPNNGARMDENARSDHTSRVNRYPRIKAAFLADRGTFTDDATRTNPGPLTDSNSRANDGTRLNGDPVGDDGVRCD